MTGPAIDFETFPVVRWYDPEIVPHNTGEVLGKYCAEREMGLLNIPPEATPVIFICRLLTRSQRRMVRSQPGEPNQYDMAFRFGVQEIRNCPGPTGPRTVQPARARPDEPITDATMDSLGLGERSEQEIGSVIWAKSELDPDVPLSCPQLASSLHAYSVVAVRHAEQKRDSQTQQGGGSDD